MMKAEIPMRLIDIQGDGNHLLIDAFVNNVKVDLLIDTGASRTVFDKTKLLEIVEDTFEKMDRLSTGLGTNSMNSEKICISSLRFSDDIIIDNYDAVALDMSHVNESYSKLGYPAITGVIGGDLLQKMNAVIDYGRKMLTLEQ
jgi:hypothetical protein